MTEERKTPYMIAASDAMLFICWMLLDIEDHTMAKIFARDWKHNRHEKWREKVEWWQKKNIQERSASA